MTGKWQAAYRQQRAYLAIFAVGVLAMISQLAFLRVATISFSGNELTLCLILGHGLLWTSLGGFIGSRRVERNSDPRLFPLFLIYAAILIIFIYALFLIRQILGIPNSQLLGIGSIFLWTLLAMGPPAFLNGLCFPLLMAYGEAGECKPAVRKMYALDVFGSATGAILFALMIGLGLHSFRVLHLMVLLFLVCVSFILPLRRGLRYLIVVTAAMFTLGLWGWGFAQFLALKWQPADVRLFTESPYVSITLTGYADRLSLFGDNEPIVSNGNVESAEETIHFALLSHPEPRRILLIGIVSPEMQKQLQYYSSVCCVTAVSPDRKLVGTIRKYFGQDVPRSWLKTIFADPFHFLRRTAEQFDVIIVNVPLPVNVQWNRFYTAEFYRLCEMHLDGDGILAMQFPAGESFLTDEHASFLRSMQATLATVFRHYAWIPGETAHLLGSDQAIRNDYPTLLRRLDQLTAQPQYVQDYYLFDRLSPLRTEFLQRNLESQSDFHINRLLHPVGFYYDTVLWDQRVGGWIKPLYQYLKGIKSWIPATVFVLLLAVVSSILRRQKSRRNMLCLNMLLAGFILMSLESILIILFQSFVSGVYGRIMLLTLAFMLGASCGAWLQNRILPDAAKLHVALALFIVLVVVVGGLLFVSLAPLLYALCIILILICAGLLGGIIFPVLSRLLQFYRQSSLASSAGQMYAWDVIGSCCGAYLVSALIIPVYGIPAAVALTAGVAIILALVNLGVRWRL